MKNITIDCSRWNDEIDINKFTKLPKPITIKASFVGEKKGHPMLKFQFSDHLVEVVFEHNNVPAKVKGNKYTLVKLTICTVFLGKEVLALGESQQSPEDNFCKNTGRKLALTRCLRHANLSGEHNKALRTRIWMEYFAARNGRKD